MPSASHIENSLKLLVLISPWRTAESQSRTLAVMLSTELACRVSARRAVSEPFVRGRRQEHGRSARNDLCRGGDRRSSSPRPTATTRSCHGRTARRWPTAVTPNSFARRAAPAGILPLIVIVLGQSGTHTAAISPLAHPSLISATRSPKRPASIASRTSCIRRW